MGAVWKLMKTDFSPCLLTYNIAQLTTVCRVCRRNNIPKETDNSFSAGVWNNIPVGTTTSWFSITKFFNRLSTSGSIKVGSRIYFTGNIYELYNCDKLTF